MLNKRETAVMSAVYSLCDGSDGCLISALDILSVLPAKKKISPAGIDDILNDLKCDGYFDLIVSERMGEKMYVIHLKENGQSFRRAATQKRRDIAFKLLLALIGAIATFIFGLIIKGIFG